MSSITSKPDPTKKPAVAAVDRKPVVASAKPAGPVASAKPGTEDPAARKAANLEKKKAKMNARAPYPGLIDAEGKPTKKLESIPTDFDAKNHRPLKRANFAGDGLAMRWQVAVLRAKADRIEDQAKKVEALGNRVDQQKAKRLVAMTERMAELRKDLEGEGVDVDALLAELMVDKKE